MVRHHANACRPSAAAAIIGVMSHAALPSLPPVFCQTSVRSIGFRNQFGKPEFTWPFAAGGWRDLARCLALMSDIGATERSPTTDRIESMTASRDFQAFQIRFASEQASVWRRIYERNQTAIKVKNARLAETNLELIVGATLKICNHRGFTAMSLRDLSRETGLSMGAIYSYIDSKEDLLAMILEQVLHLVEMILGTAADELPPQEHLRELLCRHVFLTEIMQPWFFFAYMEAKGFSDWGRRMAIGSELRTQGLIASCLAAGQVAGVFQPLDPDMVASLIKPLLQDWYLKRWKYRRRNVSPDDYAAWVIRFVEAFVRRTAESFSGMQGAELMG